MNGSLFWDLLHWRLSWLSLSGEPNDQHHRIPRKIKGCCVISADFTIYASDDSETSITEAREYIKREGLTADDVRLIRKEGQVLIITKREIWK